MKGLLFTYLLTYGGSLAALFRPFVGLCIYYSFAVLRPQSLWSFALSPNANYSSWPALAAFIGWGLRGFPRKDSSRGVLAVLLVMAGFILVYRMSAWTALNPLIAATPASDMSKIFLMFLLGFYLLDSTQRLKAFLWIFILSQAYLTYDLNKSYFLNGVNVVLQNGFGGLDNNTFALSLLPGTALAMMTCIYEPRKLYRGISLCAMFSSLHVVLLSQSRGAYLGLIVIGFLGAILMPKNIKTVSLFLLIVVLSSLLIGDSVREEFATIFARQLDRSAEGRFAHWGAAYRAMMDYPLLGVGPLNFGEVSSHYGLAGGRAPHNLFLEVGTDCGLIGLVLFVSFFSLIFWKTFRVIPWRAASASEMDPVIASVVSGAFIGLCGYLLSSFFSSGLRIETPYMAALAAVAAVRLLNREASKAASEETAVEMPEREYVSMGHCEATVQ